jgi:hypothetical protein
MFAVSDRWLARGWPSYFDSIDGSGKQLTHSADFVYMSWTNLTTLGSNFFPNSIGAQALNIAEVTSGVLLLTAILAVILGAVHPTVRPDP